jgi:hypothetical protein
MAYSAEQEIFLVMFFSALSTRRSTLAPFHLITLSARANTLGGVRLRLYCLQGKSPLVILLV